VSLADRFSVAWLCKQLGVARSGFYAWRQRLQNPGPRAQENPVITTQVQAVFERHRGFYGASRVHQELRSAGLKVERHRVARLMRCSALKTVGEAFSKGVDRTMVQALQEPRDPG
jgi:putative transposase